MMTDTPLSPTVQSGVTLLTKGFCICIDDSGANEREDEAWEWLEMINVYVNTNNSLAGHIHIQIQIG